MFRITATIIVPNNTFETVTFHIRAANVAFALTQAIDALALLGFEADEYSLAHSVNLEAAALHQKDHGDTDASQRC